MPPIASNLIQKVWSYAGVLKDDGLAFMDYTEQITYLLFLKMAWEQREQTASDIPSRYTWSALLDIAEDAKLLERYHQALKNLSNRPGLIGLIFTKPQSKINDPAKLRHLIHLINEDQWSDLDLDVKGEVYESLLARNADDVRGGAGQYFTPRPVVRAIVEVMRPTPQQQICDPACGTGGFLLAAHDYLRSRLKTAEDRRLLATRSLVGMELVPNVARLCAMNLFLRGIGRPNSAPPISIGDSLEKPADKVDMVLTNPPFGRRSSVTIVGRDGKVIADRLSYDRPDFWATTSNKQLNFLQHVVSMLKPGGCAAVVVPDNVLYEGGAGEVIRRRLLESCDVHTLLRLPTGIWYSHEVKANVLFFEKHRQKANSSSTSRVVWVYDLRSGLDFSLRRRPIGTEHLEDFIACYGAEDRNSRVETARFRRFSYDDLLHRDKANFDVQWNVEGPSDVHAPKSQELMKQIIADLQQAMEEFASIDQDLRNESPKSK